GGKKAPELHGGVQGGSGAAGGGGKAFAFGSGARVGSSARDAARMAASNRRTGWAHAPGCVSRQWQPAEPRGGDPTVAARERGAAAGEGDPKKSSGLLCQRAAV
ncbi:MAG: Mobile element protein, partial [uncultured Gemmatimonadetes bacterium]